MHETQGTGRSEPIIAVQQVAGCDGVVGRWGGMEVVVQGSLRGSVKGFRQGLGFAEGRRARCGPGRACILLSNRRASSHRWIGACLPRSSICVAQPGQGDLFIRQQPCEFHSLYLLPFPRSGSRFATPTHSRFRLQQGHDPWTTRPRRIAERQKPPLGHIALAWLIPAPSGVFYSHPQCFSEAVSDFGSSRDD